MDYAVIRGMNVGFIGVGNMSQAIIRRLIGSGVLRPDQIFGTNRSPGKLHKLQEQLGIQIAKTNEELVDSCQVVIIATKPQDLLPALEPIASSFLPNQILISLAAGLRLDTLSKTVPACRVVRVMPNTPAQFGEGVVGYCTAKLDAGLKTIVEDLFNPMGLVVGLEEGESFDALAVACASGTGFVLELMEYWQDWIEERGVESKVARAMAVQTFLGAAKLAAQLPETEISDLIAKVASKKGITEAGLQSMRELELERGLRYSFEKADLRNKELS